MAPSLYFVTTHHCVQKQGGMGNLGVHILWGPLMPLGLPKADAATLFQCQSTLPLPEATTYF